MILYSIIIILVLHYITFMCNIGTRFKLLNLCIEKSIENLPKIHLKIVECVKIYNIVYGTPMLGTFTIFFVWCCMGASTIVIIPKNSTLAITFLIPGVLTTMLFTYLIIKAAQKITYAKQSLIEILYTKLVKEPENCDKICKLIMQIRHTNVGFCCNFFEINWNLMFKFITAGVMYLIIIVQFEGSINVEI